MWPEGPRALASGWCGPARQVLASSSRPAWTTGVILSSFGLSRTHSHSLSLSEDADPAPTRDAAALPSLSLATAHTPDRVPVFQPLCSLPEPSPRSGGRREGGRGHRVPKAPLSHWMTSEGLASLPHLFAGIQYEETQVGCPQVSEMGVGHVWILSKFHREECCRKGAGLPRLRPLTYRVTPTHTWKSGLGRAIRELAGGRGVWRVCRGPTGLNPGSSYVVTEIRARGDQRAAPGLRRGEGLPSPRGSHQPHPWGPTSDFGPRAPGRPVWGSRHPHK